MDSDEWEQAREEHFQKICCIWDIDPNAFPVPPTALPAQWTVVLEGLISIADWIGSSLDFPLKHAKPQRIRKDPPRTD